MPRRVVDLYACWWIVGSAWSAVVCERWCLRACCGVYGGKKMTKVLRIVGGE
jgi:hypothetical protein